MKRTIATLLAAGTLASGASLIATQPAIATTVAVQAEGPGGYAPVLAVCIRKIVNLPGLDIPDQPTDLMIGGQVSCPARGG